MVSSGYKMLSSYLLLSSSVFALPLELINDTEEHSWFLKFLLNPNPKWKKKPLDEGKFSFSIPLKAQFPLIKMRVKCNFITKSSSGHNFQWGLWVMGNEFSCIHKI